MSARFTFVLLPVRFPFRAGKNTPHLGTEAVMIGVTRGISTLAGAAVAGILLWFAAQIGAEATGEYWATYGLIAAAGLTMALSQILGGWTKWGWPRFSMGVFVLSFLPVLVAGGWVLLARQPADWMNTSNWSRDLGIFGVVDDLGNILPAIAFGIGLVFGLSFDTKGPRKVVERETPAPVTTVPTEGRDTRAADESLTADDDVHRDPPTVPVEGLADKTEEDRTVTTTRTDQPER
jgi:hypothetical protein